MSDEVKETLASDGRQVLYSITKEDDKMPTATEEWLASDMVVSGKDLPMGWVR